MINYDLLIICLTFIAIFYLNSREKKLTPATATEKPDGDELTDIKAGQFDVSQTATVEPEIPERKKEEKVDFFNLSLSSNEAILREWNLIENRSAAPAATISPVEKKQKLAYEMHKRKLNQPEEE